MFWFLVPHFLASVSGAYDYYSDIDWASAPKQLPYQDFNPSSKYDTAYPYQDPLYTNLVDPNQNIYDYAILATNLIDTGDLLATDTNINGKDSRKYKLLKQYFTMHRVSFK